MLKVYNALRVEVGSTMIRAGDTLSSKTLSLMSVVEDNDNEWSIFVKVKIQAG